MNASASAMKAWTREALWDLWWAGIVTTDEELALRTLPSPSRELTILTLVWGPVLGSFGKRAELATEAAAVLRDDVGLPAARLQALLDVAVAHRRPTGDEAGLASAITGAAQRSRHSASMREWPAASPDPIGTPNRSTATATPPAGNAGHGS